MVTVEKIERIRLLLRDGGSIRGVARALGVSRAIVRRARLSPEPKVYTPTEPRAAPRLGPHQAWIEQVLQEDRDQRKKLRHTAKRIYDRLVAEHGFAGDPSTVRRYVARRKRELGRGPEVFVPREHPPARDVEIDWGTRPVKIAGQLVDAHLLAVRPAYSGLPFARAYPLERQEAFFDGLQEASRFYDGVFHRWTFDNLTLAVKKVLRGRTREEQDAFTLLRSHFLFDPVFTLAGEEGAHEKGGVEGLVGYIGRNWFVPTPGFESWDALNEWLLSKCREEEVRTAQGKTRSMGELFAEEKPLLLPLPAYPFDPCRRLEVRADTKSRVRFETNHYSVPSEFATRPVTLKAYWDRVTIVAADRVVATHRRLHGRHDSSLEPLHYLAVLEKKPALWHYGEPFVRWNLPAVFDQLRERLEANHPRGLRQYVKVIRAIPTCGLYAVTEAIAETLATRGPDVEAILLRLSRSPKPVAATGLPNVSVPVPPLTQYEALLPKEFHHGNEPALADVPQEAPAADDRARP